MFGSASSVALEVLIAQVVVVPVLPLEGVNEGMLLRLRVLAPVLRRRLIAAADVATRDASAQVEPPAILRGEAFHAARAAGWDGRVDQATACFLLDPGLTLS
jgi:hypothetical protein